MHFAPAVPLWMGSLAGCCGSLCPAPPSRKPVIGIPVEIRFSIPAVTSSASPGVNWYGFETTDEVVHGLWAQDYHYILNAIKSNGYNVIRMPMSNQIVETPIIPTNISYSNGSGPINTDLKGLNSLQILDKIVAYAGSDRPAHHPRQPSLRSRQRR